MSLWRPAIIAGVLMAACFVRALTWQLVDHGPSGQNLTPRGEHLLTAACLAMPLFPAGALLWAAISRRLKRRLTITLVLMVLLGAVGGAATLFAWMKLFEGKYQATVISPDGALEAHLYVDGLLGCTGTVYVSERRGLWGSPAATRAASCDDIGVRWTEDGGVEVSGSAPEPLNLDWGPH